MSLPVCRAQSSGYPTIRDIWRAFVNYPIYPGSAARLSLSTRWTNSHDPANPDRAGANRINTLIRTWAICCTVDTRNICCVTQWHIHNQLARAGGCWRVCRKGSRRARRTVQTRSLAIQDGRTEETRACEEVADEEQHLAGSARVVSQTAELRTRRNDDWGSPLRS